MIRIFAAPMLAAGLLTAGQAHAAIVEMTFDGYFADDAAVAPGADATLRLAIDTDTPPSGVFPALTRWDGAISEASLLVDGTEFLIDVSRRNRYLQYEDEGVLDPHQVFFGLEDPFGSEGIGAVAGQRLDQISAWLTFGARGAQVLYSDEDILLSDYQSNVDVSDLRAPGIGFSFDDGNQTLFWERISLEERDTSPGPAPGVVPIPAAGALLAGGLAAFVGLARRRHS